MIKISRIFEPALKNKKTTVKVMVENAVGVLWFDIIPLISIPLLISAVQTRDAHASLVISGFSVLAFVVLGFIHLKIRHWDFLGKYTYQAYLEKVYRKQILLKDNLALEKIGTGKLQTTVQKGMFSWAESNWQISYQIPRALITVGTGLYLTFTFGVLYSLVFLLMIATSGYFFFVFKKKELFFKEKSDELDTEQTHHSVRSIMSRQEIVLSNNVDKEVDRLYGYELKQIPIHKYVSKYDIYSEFSTVIFGLLMPYALVSLFVYTGRFETIETGMVVALIYFASRFTFLMYNLVWAIRVFMDRYPQIKTFWEFLDTTPKLSQYEQGALFKHNVGEVKLQQVCFGYEEGKNLITNFSLTIQGGTKVAFVGHSGSGKTTIVKLIAGYLQPKQGRVLVDGQDISEVSLASYYKDIGYLTQDPMVFDGTIKENMQYATAETLSDEQMWKALDLAECGFVRDMKDGLNSAIGEKGVRLSGGERQRLAIAKLFIKNPKIIILDEPTSALDSFAEDNITKALHKLFKDRTVIIIAHRLQTVQEADVIYVMEKGHIIEQGTHKGLIKQKGLYADMLKLQSGF